MGGSVLYQEPARGLLPGNAGDGAGSGGGTVHETAWARVGLFVSSTFDDMHAERDYLVKRVLPRLYAWCEERRLHLVDVDLRWGDQRGDLDRRHVSSRDRGLRAVVRLLPRPAFRTRDRARGGARPRTGLTRPLLPPGPGLRERSAPAVGLRLRERPRGRTGAAEGNRRRRGADLQRALGPGGRAADGIRVRGRAPGRPALRDPLGASRPRGGHGH